METERIGSFFMVCILQGYDNDVKKKVRFFVRNLKNSPPSYTVGGNGQPWGYILQVRPYHVKKKL